MISIAPSYRSGMLRMRPSAKISMERRASRSFPVSTFHRRLPDVLSFWCVLPKELEVLDHARMVRIVIFFIITGCPDHFGQHHQVIDVLGYTQNTSSSSQNWKQVLPAIVFLKLLDYAPDQPLQSPLLPVSQSSEFLCRNQSLSLQEERSRRVVGIEKKWCNLLWFTQILNGSAPDQVSG